MRPTSNNNGPEKGLDAAAASAWVLRALARREHSAEELRSRLIQRGCDPDLASEVIEHMIESGWQSDARFAQARVRSRLNRGYGPLRAQADLLRAGIGADLRSAALQSGADTDSEAWLRQARAVRERRFGALPEDAGQWQRQYRFLATRGFSPTQIRAVLSTRPDDGDPSPDLSQ